MKVIIFKNESGGVSKLTPTLEALEILSLQEIFERAVKYETLYFEVDDISLPIEPMISWELSDNGSININQDKLDKYNRSILPTLTPIEFDLKLAEFELYDAVQNLISGNLQLKIAYTRATFFSRTDPFIDQARIALGLTDEQVDTMWESPLAL